MRTEDLIVGGFFFSSAAVIGAWLVVFWWEHLAAIRAFMHDCFCDEDDAPDRTTSDRPVASALAADRLRAARARLDAAARTGAPVAPLRDVSGHVARVGRPLGDARAPLAFAARPPKGFKRIW